MTRRHYGKRANLKTGVTRKHSLPYNFYYYDLPVVICDIAIYADDTNLCSKCDRATNLWQQHELASELESDLRDTLDWGKKWLVDFNAGKSSTCFG